MNPTSIDGRVFADIPPIPLQKSSQLHFKLAPRNRTLAAYLILTAAAVALGDWLLYAKPAGLNLALYGGFLLASLLFRAPQIVQTLRTRILIYALLGLFATLIIMPGILACLLATLGLILLGAKSRSIGSGYLPDWIRYSLRFALLMVIQPFSDLRLCFRWQRSGRGYSVANAVSSILQKWTLPVALSALFALLFFIANPVISRSIIRFEVMLDKLLIHLSLTAGRFFLWMLLGVFGWALLRVRSKAKTRAGNAAFHSTAGGVLDSDLIVRCLTVFNLLFAVQTALDVIYLWGGAALPGGMSYAEYAHRGAYPLIATALLAGMFVLVTFNPRAMSRSTPIARKLVYLWLGQNIFLTFSSVWRLILYIESYNLTRWRVAAAIWMLLVAAGLFWIGVRIVTARSNRWLINVNLAMLMLVLYACCFVNFSGAISWYNVTHCREAGGAGVPIDLNYLKRLGPESIPALIWLSLEAPDLRERITPVNGLLHAQLKQQTQDWRGWTLRRIQLLIQAQRAGLPVAIRKDPVG